MAYAVALRALRSHVDHCDEIVLTGEQLVRAGAPLQPILEKMATRELHAWQMTGNIDGPPESLAEEGFPSRDLAWHWLAVRRQVLFSPSGPACGRAPRAGAGRSQLSLLRPVSRRGRRSLRRTTRAGTLRSSRRTSSDR